MLHCGREQVSLDFSLELWRKKYWSLDTFWEGRRDKELKDLKVM